ncbi:helix-turn-helix domain-containing protein [Psychroserpens sp.]
MKNIIEALPRTELKDVFKNYLFCTIKQESTENTGLVVEDGLFEFCFLKEQDIHIQSNGKNIPLPKSFSFGKIPLPYRFVIPTTMTYFTIKIHPWAAAFFFDENNSLAQDLSKTLYENIDQLHANIFSTTSFDEQVNYVENFFINQDLSDLYNYETSKNICNYIYENDGNIKIKPLLELFPHSRQKLNQLFLRQTKNSIKEFAVYTRLRSIMSYQVKYPGESLTTIAYKFGYFDQSHFIKDMKKVTGIAPSEFLNTSNFFFEQLKK